MLIEAFVPVVHSMARRLAMQCNALNLDGRFFLAKEDGSGYVVRFATHGDRDRFVEAMKGKAVAL
jgi:hypothetical protein